MKNKKYIIALFAVLGFSACKTGNDLYISPNSPGVVNAPVLLTALEVNSFLNTEGDLARTSSILDQQFAGANGQYQALQNYDITESDFNNHWVGLYANTMVNAKIIIDQYQAKDPYYAGFAQVIMAMNLGIATDLWGDVPYSQAFSGVKNLKPAYDSQQQVIASIQTLLDNAITNLSKPASANTDIPAGDDLIYSGDPAKWIKAAWVIKARYANRLSLKDSKGSATLVLQYLAKGITDAGDNMENQHPASGVAQNQWGQFDASNPGFLVANKVFLDALGDSDPRLGFYFAQTDKGTYVGGDITQETINTSASGMGTYFDVATNYPVVTSYEADFLKAEATSRLGNDASGALNDAIKGSVKYATKGGDDGSSIAKYTAATATMTAIMTEKWKAMFGQIEAYNDFRRTGIPALTPRPGSAGAIRSYIPKRLPTPEVERTANPNAKVYALDQPVWWATAN